MSVLETARQRTPGGPGNGSAAPDSVLVDRLRSGDEGAFEAIFHRHQPQLLSFARHMLGGRDDAEDALQQTFIRAHRALLSDSPPRELRPWLYAIARNCCHSVIAARRPVAGLEDHEPSLAGLSEAVHQREDLRELVGDLQALPEDQRSALLLAELEDLAHHEIAAILRCPVTKVKALVHQARTTLIAQRDARAAPCEEIRMELSVARGGELRRGPLRRHLGLCPGCRDYATAVRAQRSSLAAILPVIPSAGLAARVLGHAGGLAGAGAGGVGAASAGHGAVAALATGGASASAVGSGGVAIGAAGAAGSAGAGASAVLGGGLAAKLAIGGAVAVIASVGAVKTLHHVTHHHRRAVSVALASARPPTHAPGAQGTPAASAGLPGPSTTSRGGTPVPVTSSPRSRPARTAASARSGRARSVILHRRRQHLIARGRRPKRAGVLTSPGALSRPLRHPRTALQQGNPRPPHRRALVPRHPRALPPPGFVVPGTSASPRRRPPNPLAGSGTRPGTGPIRPGKIVGRHPRPILGRAPGVPGTPGGGSGAKAGGGGSGGGGSGAKTGGGGSGTSGPAKIRRRRHP